MDDNSHYVFTPRDLTKWTLSLVRYVIGEHDKSPSSVLEAWAYEACRLFRDKLATEEDIEKFDAILKNVLYADWNSKAADNLKQMVYTTSGDANFSARSPLPKFGRGLGCLPLQNWEQVVEKGNDRRKHETLKRNFSRMLAFISFCQVGIAMLEMFLEKEKVRKDQHRD